MMNNYRKGFTLIELLIVIAIIGILAGIVVVSLSGSTASATEARIKTALRSVDTLWKDKAIKDSTSGQTIPSNDICNESNVKALMDAVFADVVVLHGTTATPNVPAVAAASRTTGSNYAGVYVISASPTAEDITGTGNAGAGGKKTPAAGCVSSKEGWAVWARVINDGTDDKYHCIDTTGFNGEKTTQNGTGDASNPAVKTDEVKCGTLLG